jgi:N-acetylmuramoyl-L-alanine amidase
MPMHVVKQGEHLASIAQDYGHRAWQTIWEHASNQSLRAARDNPNVLQPGDQVFVPDLAPRDESCATEARHRFRARGSALRLRLRVLGPAWKPADAADVMLTVGTLRSTEPTTSDGRLDLAIRPDDRAGRLRVDHDSLPHPIEGDVLIGGLDPVETVTGQIARLNNLGYDAGPVEEPATPAAEERVRSAVEEFQCDHALDADGIAGPKTQTKLKDVHGC